jgi:hypothetical protein
MDERIPLLPSSSPNCPNVYPYQASGKDRQGICLYHIRKVNPRKKRPSASLFSYLHSVFVENESLIPQGRPDKPTHASQGETECQLGKIKEPTYIGPGDYFEVELLNNAGGLTSNEIANWKRLEIPCFCYGPICLVIATLRYGGRLIHEEGGYSAGR